MHVEQCIYSFFLARKLVRGIDDSPVLVTSTDESLDCPSAIEEWTAEY